MDSPVWTKTDSGRQEGKGERAGVMDSRGSSRERRREEKKSRKEEKEKRREELK